MPAPTLYFPSNVKYKLGFTRDQRWNTESGPETSTGRVQVFKNWTFPKRRMRLTVLGLGGSGSISEASNKAMRQFLYKLAGIYTPFYVFNPKEGDYDAGANVFPATLDPLQTLATADWSAFPVTCPFANGTITNIYKNGVLYRTSGQFTQDQGGTGGETRILTVNNPQPAAHDVLTVDVTGANERIPARLLSDVESWGYDWQAANPPTEYDVPLEEYFG